MPPLRRPTLPVIALALVAARIADAGPQRTVDPEVARLAAVAPRANPDVLSLALRAAECARSRGKTLVPRLAVIDYSLPSTRPRLWVFDLDRQSLLFEELVAHGKGTGERLSTRFSNVEGSKMSSLGLFRTASTYVGANGYSLRLEGLEPGYNDRAEARAIVMHGAPYVSRALADRMGRIGRSWGCPAVRSEIARPVIDALKGGSLLFAYYPDSGWLRDSRYLSCPPSSGVPAITARDREENPAASVRTGARAAGS
jgi:hypothetical protein